MKRERKKEREGNHRGTETQRYEGEEKERESEGGTYEEESRFH